MYSGVISSLRSGLVTTGTFLSNAKFICVEAYFKDLRSRFMPSLPLPM